MGLSTSKGIERVESVHSEKSQLNEKIPFGDKNVDVNLRGLSVEEGSDGSITAEKLSRWEHDLLSDPKNKLAQNVFGGNSITNSILESKVLTKLNHQFLFNTQVKTIGSPEHLNNQQMSGRCWIFATSNVLRSHVIENYNLKDNEFQLSQSYLFFYDKLEKANYYLENIIDTAEEDLESRLVSHLMSDPVGDGGQWDMIVNVVEKYGLVPNEFFPDDFQATLSSQLNYVVTEKLREYGLVLRELVTKGASEEKIVDVKNAANKKVFEIIALALGNPPKPDDPFVWEFKDKDGNYKYYDTTPKDFYKTHVRYNVSSRFSLINDPRNSYDKLYTVDRLNNISGGKPIEYVNSEISDLKSVAIKMLKNNEPVFFGSDVGKYILARDSGVLDVEAFDYELAFGSGLNLTKAERLRTGSSSMTHAMVITGVHLDPKSGAPVRWKIENSWGPDVGKKGYYLMTDKWFDEFVFQIVSEKKYVSKKAYDLFKRKEYITLPYYDPMGALA